MRIKNEMRLDFPALKENESFARMVISAFLVPLNPTIEEMADVKTAVSEAVTNAIVHAYRKKSGMVRLQAFYRSDGMLIVDIRDHGCGIQDIQKAREPFFTTLESEERSGMGFTVMESFMDSVEVRSRPDEGTAVRMFKQLKAHSEAYAQEA